MQDNYYDNYGVLSGYNQVAPGRDSAVPRTPGQPGRPPSPRPNPNVPQAIAPSLQQQPNQPTPTFRGAQQTIGAPTHTGGIADVSQAVQGPGYQAPEAGGFTGGAGVQEARQENAQPAQPTYDTSHWNTKGYATPQYIADAVNGSAPAGWDQTKWADANYQDPKYVIGRLEMQDSGGDGLFQTPEERQKLIADIQRAYPGASFDGKDMIQLPDGGAPIDIFRGAGAGIYGMQFAPADGGGGSSSQPAQPGGSYIQNAIMGAPGMTPQTGTYAQQLLQQLMQQLNKSPNLKAIAQQSYGI